MMVYGWSFHGLIGSNKIAPIRHNRKLARILSIKQALYKAKPRSYQVVTGRGGVHGDTKYNSRKAKAEARRIINDEM